MPENPVVAASPVPSGCMATVGGLRLFAVRQDNSRVAFVDRYGGQITVAALEDPQSYRFVPLGGEAAAFMPTQDLGVPATVVGFSVGDGAESRLRLDVFKGVTAAPVFGPRQWLICQVPGPSPLQQIVRFGSDGARHLILREGVYARHIGYSSAVVCSSCSGFQVLSIAGDELLCTTPWIEGRTIVEEAAQLGLAAFIVKAQDSRHTLLIAADGISPYHFTFDPAAIKALAVDVPGRGIVVAIADRSGPEIRWALGTAYLGDADEAFVELAVANEASLRAQPELGAGPLPEAVPLPWDAPAPETAASAALASASGATTEVAAGATGATARAATRATAEAATAEAATAGAATAGAATADAARAVEAETSSAPGSAAMHYRTIVVRSGLVLPQLPNLWLQTVESQTLTRQNLWPETPLTM